MLAFFFPLFLLPYDELGFVTIFEEHLQYFLGSDLEVPEGEPPQEQRREAMNLTMESSIILLTSLLFAGITLPFFGVGVNHGCVLAFISSLWFCFPNSLSPGFYLPIFLSCKNLSLPLSQFIVVNHGLQEKKVGRKKDTDNA